MHIDLCVSSLQEGPCEALLTYAEHPPDAAEHLPAAPHMKCRYVSSEVQETIQDEFYILQRRGMITSHHQHSSSPKPSAAGATPPLKTLGIWMHLAVARASVHLSVQRRGMQKLAPHIQIPQKVFGSAPSHKELMQTTSLGPLAVAKLTQVPFLNPPSKRE